MNNMHLRNDVCSTVDVNGTAINTSSIGCVGSNINDDDHNDGYNGGGGTLDNLAIPTVYTETNVICNEYYSNMLAGYSAKDTKSNMELLSLDLYSMNPAIGAAHNGHLHKGPPDLIPTFYYNPSTSTNSDCTTIADDRTDLMSSINT
ncbi:hypothetical protein BLA29_010770 [Euroglyphus maynei]|uniref:Uncharacterized protein n=1 Tax=Euroglyphus maynei TaxID=6958 RepID=A0A1Y3B4Q2_EURMA|nr:hypothetical protein BLA29_010770 [Euroglyphus maynei]